MIEKVELDDEYEEHCFAMGDFEIHLVKSNHIIKIIYVSEPPFGDSYHKLFIDEIEFKGFVWGCNFLFPFKQEYLICSWMEKLYDRKTIIIDLQNLAYHMLPKYYYSFEGKLDFVEFKNSQGTEIKTLNLEEITNKVNRNNG